LLLCGGLHYGNLVDNVVTNCVYLAR
jgi:hypothetical protein